MRYTPVTPTGNDLVVAAQPSLGANWRVKVSGDSILTAATGEFSAADAAATNIGTGITPGGGLLQAHFQLVLLDYCPSADPIVFTFGCTDEEDTVGTAKATLIPPPYHTQPDDGMPVFAAADIVVQGVDLDQLEIKELEEITAVVGGSAGVRFEIWQMPAASSYREFLCARDKNPTEPYPSSVAVACGNNGSAYVLRGRSVPGELEVTSLAYDYAADVRRFNGARVTAMLEAYKDNRVLTERAVYRDWNPVVNFTGGDGDDESEVTASGMFTVPAHFNCNGT